MPWTMPVLCGACGLMLGALLMAYFGTRVLTAPKNTLGLCFSKGAGNPHSIFKRRYVFRWERRRIVYVPEVIHYQGNDLEFRTLEALTVHSIFLRGPDMFQEFAAIAQKIKHKESLSYHEEESIKRWYA